MNVIRPIAETGDTVTLRRADFEALLEAVEDAEDIRALHAAEARETEIGKEAARANPLDECGNLDDPSVSSPTRIAPSGSQQPFRVWKSTPLRPSREAWPMPLRLPAKRSIPYFNVAFGDRKSSAKQQKKFLAPPPGRGVGRERYRRDRGQGGSTASSTT